MFKSVVFYILTILTVSGYSQSKQIAILKHKFDGNFNVVYSPTLEISWYHLKKSLIGSGDLMISDPPSILEYLNGFEFHSGLFRNQNILTFSGRLDHNRYDSLTDLLSNSNLFRAYDFKQHIGKFISYTQIAFDFKWQGFIKSKKESSIVFDHQRVHTFELNSEADNYSEFARNIRVMDYKDENDFIIKIILNDAELVLAKLNKRHSLEQTYLDVNERMGQNNRGSLVTFLDSLKIPVIAFDLSKEFKELCDRRFLNDQCGDVQLDIVKQRIGFSLDEKGVKMSSDAVEEIFGRSERQLKFNQPFLIILKKIDSSVPILVTWISNTEFMTKY